MNTLHHYDPDDPYPESDGLPMAENTEQYEWLVKIKENLEILFAEHNDVFIAGDLFWYPLPDRQQVYPIAPDVMVVIGRPKGKRGSYRQWEENGIAPQVVFEILSPSNSAIEMAQKKQFYDQYGVQEYYVYNPKNNQLEIWIRHDKHLKKMKHVGGWISPLLGINFTIEKQSLHIFYPNGQPFLSSVELARYAELQQQEKEAAQLLAINEKQEKEKALQEKNNALQEKEKALQEKDNALQEKEKALQEKDKALRLATSEHERAERLAHKLQALGINPNS